MYKINLPLQAHRYMVFYAAEWVSILFERPEFVSKVDTVLKEIFCKLFGSFGPHLDPFGSHTILTATTTAQTP